MPRRVETLVRQRSCRGAAPRPNGFVLPLAISGSLLLLISSASLQAMALHSHAQLQQVQRRQQLEDVLTSAAHQVAGALQQRSCLLGLDLAQWATAGMGCSSEEQMQALRQGQLAEHSYEVVDYRLISPPTAEAPGRAELLLELGGAKPWRAAFRLGLGLVQGDGDGDGDGAMALQVQGLQELGLRGQGSSRVVSTRTNGGAGA